MQQRPEAAAYYNLADATTKWVLPEPGFLEVRGGGAGTGAARMHAEGQLAGCSRCLGGASRLVGLQQLPAC